MLPLMLVPRVAQSVLRCAEMPEPPSCLSHLMACLAICKHTSNSVRGPDSACLTWLTRPCTLGGCSTGT